MNLDFIFSSELFGIVLSLFTFYLGTRIQKKWNYPIFHPLLISIFCIVLFLVIFHIPVKQYQKGGEFISLFLSPATTILAYSIYYQWDLLKKFWVAIVVGCFAGAVASIGSITLMCKLFHLDSALTASLLPKSVTTPIAIDVCNSLNGISSITVIAVIITGILGSIICPTLGKWFGFYNTKKKNSQNDKIAMGVATGSCSHAVGTSKAIQLGETEGAMSGIAIGISGIFTVILTLVLSLL